MFSQIIDTICERSNRIDMRNIIVSITNGVIRRIQSKQYFQSDLKEIDIDSSSNQVEFSVGQWKWKRLPDVRLISSVRYDPWLLYPPNQQPAVGQEALQNYWYKVGDNYVFRWAYNEDPESIHITYYSTSPEFNYILDSNRLIQYNWVDNTWEKRDNVNSAWETMSEQEVTNREGELRAYGNWLLRDYKEVVISGALSKLFGLLDDTERAKREFAEFNDLFTTLTNNERYANFGY